MLGVMFRLNLIWRDLRLQFNNIRTDQYLNDVSSGKQEKMWIPEISFHNAKTGRIDTDLSSDRLVQLSSLLCFQVLKFRLTVLKETDREKFSDVYAREEAFFPGTENSLSYYRRFCYNYCF